ncbi:unnamed protein product, partial [Adineta ricciae]
PFDTPIAQQLNTGSATPARSLLSDYDNLHGSYGSLNDDTQHPFPPVLPSSLVASETATSVAPTSASSVSTIYETADTSQASSSTATYVTAQGANTNVTSSNSTLSAAHINSDISDEDLVESYDVETPVLTSTDPFRSPEDHLESSTSATEQSATTSNKEAILTDKGEEIPPSSSKAASLLISSTSPSTAVPSLFSPTSSSPHMTANAESNLSSSMSQYEGTSTSTRLSRIDTIPQSPVHQRRLPLPNTLTFEQSITNLLEKESPLLQSELLTAEHELSVLRSRLAVNEGV